MRANTPVRAGWALARRGMVLIVLLALAGGCAMPAGSPPPSIPLPANVAWASRSLQGERGTPAAGEPAPDFEYTMADGSTRTLSDLRGTTVIVNFWATWCGPCREEMPELDQAMQQSNGAVTVLGVNRLESVEAIVPYAGQIGVRFMLIANPNGDIADRYGVRNLPTSFFIKPDGTIGEIRLGVMDAAAIEAGIDRAR